MKKLFSIHWKSSKKPNKQRKFRFNAPLHIKAHFLNASLSKELRQKYDTRSLRVIKGDTVEILRGDYKGKKGKVTNVDVRKTKIQVNGIGRKNSTGAFVLINLNPSNLRITELNLNDKLRVKKLDKFKKTNLNSKINKEM